jgi:DNA-binding CsgD family transcriptional regulator/pimeloyl-ACP methyl ester carboxylesterase
MSERGLTSDYSMSSLIKDLEAVVSQVQVEHFVLMGSHATGHAAISYAASHPEQVHSLILTPTSVSGRDWSVIVNVDLAGQNWEFFLSFFNQYTSAPEACAENVEILRKSVDQADWLTMARVWRDSDVEKLLPRILAPTLLLHPREYLNIPLEKSARVAALIPNARLSLIEGRSSFGDASSGLKAIDDFLAEHAGRPAMSVRPFPASLSYREIEVLRLIAAGRSNQQIADELVISLNTARKHVANILAKTGTANRTEAAAYAHDHALT